MVIVLTALGVALAAAAGSNVVLERASGTATAPDTNAAAEFQKLLDADDAAQAEVDQWIRDNDQFASKGAGLSREEMKQKIRQRFEPVRKGYEDFIQSHPRHVDARVAYASFLGDTKDEESAEEQLEKALAIDTNNPAIYNNLANICGHIGPVKKAFEYYGKAIQLNPLEPVYYHNLGTTVYLFRTDAMEFYHLNEQEVFAKAFELYSNSMRLDPDNFPLASDIAQTYYGIQPLRTNEALVAWTNALKIAHDEIEREGVYVHFARLKMMAGRFEEARLHLNAVTNAVYVDLKKRLLTNLERRQGEARGTNTVVSEQQPESNPKPGTSRPPPGP
jgi:tetratricopeptide (TPR) repeat protein